MKKNLMTAVIAMLSMLMTATCVTSCGDDDDDEDEATETTDYDWTSALTSVSATPGAKYIAKQQGQSKLYTIKVTEATTESVTLEINGTEVVLSDAGASYVSTSLEKMYKADAEADPESVLLCKKSGAKTLISPTEGSNETIATGLKTMIVEL